MSQPSDGGVPAGFHPGEWLRGEGPDSEIAICTRVRLARNVQGYAFSPSQTAEEALEVTRLADAALTAADFVEQLRVVDLVGMDQLERAVLVERHLISREHSHADRARSVAVNDDESVAVMVNEEDHVRAQVFRSGFAVDATFDRAMRIDDALVTALPIAFSEEFGFLTSCPTNVGTGMRLSVMLHLPGLVWAGEIDKATAATQKIHMTVRGRTARAAARSATSTR